MTVALAETLTEVTPEEKENALAWLWLPIVSVSLFAPDGMPLSVALPMPKLSVVVEFEIGAVVLLAGGCC